MLLLCVCESSMRHSPGISSAGVNKQNVVFQCELELKTMIHTGMDTGIEQMVLDIRGKDTRRPALTSKTY